LIPELFNLVTKLNSDALNAILRFPPKAGIDITLYLCGVDGENVWRWGENREAILLRGREAILLRGREAIPLRGLLF
jgi:hypothetical protein